MKKILLALLACASMQAAVITLGDGETNEAATLDGRRTQRVWDLGGGLTMTVTAFVSNAGGITAADITQFGSNAAGELAAIGTLGLGICSTGEGAGANCGFDEWQVDNSQGPAGRDFLVFTFSGAVNIGNIVIRQTSTGGDSDTSFASGTGLTLGQLFALLVNEGGPGNNWPDNGYPTTQLGNGYSRSVGVNANGVTQLIFGTPGTDTDDLFKVYSIDVSSAVPEPSSMLLLGTGLMGFGLIARRRRQRS